jgi:hypothetical protein
MAHLGRIKLPSPIRLAIASTSRKPALMVLSFHLGPTRRPCPGKSLRHRPQRYPKPFRRHYREGCKSGCNRDRRLRLAHREPGAKKALARVAAGTGIAVLAVNVLSWLWGV